MKKQVKKLKLAKETIHNLAGAELRKVTGGTDVSWYVGTCGCPHSLDYTCERNEPVNTN